MSVEFSISHCLSYLVALVPGLHPMLTFFLSDDLSSILDDNLIRLKGSVAAHTISSVFCFDDFNTNVVFASFLDSLAESIECAIPTPLRWEIAIPLVTFVVHISIHAILVATRLWLAHTTGLLFKF